MTFIVKKAVQDYAKKNKLQVSGDFYGALDNKVEKILAHAAKRTSKAPEEYGKGSQEGIPHFILLVVSSSSFIW